ncbi:heat-inducible transcriptional repressor HrcA [Clostridium minihomine]|uniref:heat-inducible transcriptional repressor HrcA n=1 Tax=Clostridium minihomine TaxID=2045012 RepID=UPI000C75C16B|nr:heat-inducible transcriptional repressor HrcA [Clostridium minihomine]
MELSERKLRVLAAIVDAYVKTGEPVGSKVLAADLGVSSATVRNEMADLVEIGLLEQPHTSSGRIPSQKGYRLYIDRIMNRRPISEEEQRYLDGLLFSSAYDQQKLLEGVSQVLAGLTRFAAVSTAPSGRKADIRALQFVQTSRRTAMLILLTSAGTMNHQVFRCEFDLSPEILRVFFRVLNEKLAGVPVAAVTPAFIQTLAASLGELTVLMSSALMALLEAAQESVETEVRLNGQMNLLFHPEFERGNARRVMDFLERPQDLAQLLLQPQQEVRVMIGEETHHPELRDSSIIIAQYAIDGEKAGAIGLIGPTRMDYAGLIAKMEYLSRTVGRRLTELRQEE